MKKIPTLFKRVFENHEVVAVTADITPGCEEAFLNGIATVKVDGSCCAVIDGVFYKRYDAKKGKKAPVGAIPCCDPDPITGHHPHWVKVDSNNSADKWFVEAYRNRCDELNGSFISSGLKLKDGTYEAVGPHFQGNPYGYSTDILERHGSIEIEIERTFESVMKYLTEHEIEGIVFWLNDEPVCKIKRSDFGLPWN